MMKKAKTKTAAIVFAVQNRDEAVEAVKRLGDLIRQKEAAEAKMNEAISELQKNAEQEVAPLLDEMQAIESGVHAWATANRDALTEGGKVKFVDLTTGVLKWRNDPPKCQIRGNDAVLALMQSNSIYERFIRIKREVNKEAVLNEAEFFTQNPVAGLSIVSGKEWFKIEPFNQELGA